MLISLTLGQLPICAINRKSMKLYIFDVTADLIGKKVKKPMKQLDLIEMKIGSPLPVKYREYLAEWAAPVSFDSSIRFSPEEKPLFVRPDGTLSVESIYGLGDGDSSIDEAINIYLDRLPDNFIPIGGLRGGNLLCMAVKGEIFGKVYTWNHELELDEKRVPNSADTVLKLVSNDFETFLKSLIAKPDECKRRTLTELGVDIKRLKLDF